MLPFARLILLERDSKTPTYLQIVNRFVQLIQEGVLQPGAKLPGTRPLAKAVQVHRNTLIRSFEELESLGWVRIEANRGTFVVDALPVSKAQEWIGDTPQNENSQKEAFQFYNFPNIGLPTFHPYTLAFDDGLPDIRLAPTHELAAGYARSLRRMSAGKLLGYGDALGNPYLREVLAEEMNNTRGLNIGKENVLITRGTIMANYLAGSVVLKKGDVIGVGDTNYGTANTTFSYLGAQLLKIPVDHKGLDTKEVEKMCEKKSLRAIYVTSHHHHPTTVPLAPERRMHLLALATKFRFAVIEDDYDYDFHYSNRPFLPLASADKHDLVLYLGSFSKTIYPAFRIGFLIGPAPIIFELQKIRRLLDRQGSMVEEQALAELIANGTLRRYLKKAKRQYKERRDFCCALLRERCGNRMKFEVPEGGLAIWAAFDPDLDLRKLAPLALAKGLYLSDGEKYSPSSGYVNATRMGFASMNLGEMESAVKLLESLM